MRRVKSLMSADTSDQLIRLGVGQKVKPRARTDDSSLESGVCDRLMTEVVSTNIDAQLTKLTFHRNQPLFLNIFFLNLTTATLTCN